MLELRPYQQQARDAVLHEWDEGRQKTLLVQATGTGKTIVFASIAKTQADKGHRILIMAHRGELLHQAQEKLIDACGLYSVLEKADQSSFGSMVPVTVASVQSLTQEKRLAKFPEDYFQDIIVDEAHHCLSESYQRVLKHFPDANILGVTATPDRGDKQQLGDYFDSLAFEYSMSQAIKDGYLCPIMAQMLPLKLDISNVGISNGDYAVGEIGNALEPYLYQIAQEMTNYCMDRKTVIFLPLISISQEFCRILNEHGFNAVEVNGMSKDREQILKDFDDGKYNALCNSMLLTEGWDCPSVDCIVNLRPTKVRALYQQIVGRGTRLYPGKKNLLLLDFLWMTERHDICRPSSLVAKNAEIAKAIDEKIESSQYCVDLEDAENEAEEEEMQKRESSLAKELERMRKNKAKLVDPLQYSLSISAEDLVNYEPTFAWEFMSPSNKQLKFLEDRGIDTCSIRNAGMASVLIDRLIRRQDEGLSTPKQIRCLERYGFRQVGTWRFTSANAMISRIANNNWMVPYGINTSTYKPKETI